MEYLLSLTMFLPLVAGGVVFLFGFLPRLRKTTQFIALGTCAAVLILVLILRWGPSADLTPSLWRPGWLFGVAPGLESQSPVCPLAMGWGLVPLSGLLLALSRDEDASPSMLVIQMVLLTLGLFVTWSSNPLTMLLGWALYDIVQSLGIIVSGGTMRTAVRGFVFGCLSTLFLWSGIVLMETNAGTWAAVAMGNPDWALWWGAALLRLWIFPVHLALPDDLQLRTPSSLSLMAGPLLGWILVGRIASLSAPLWQWLSLLGAVTSVAGALLSWSTLSVRGTISWIGMAINGIGLLAVTWTGAQGAVTAVVAGLAWMSSITLLALSDGLHREAFWWDLPVLPGLLSLLGLPFTTGFLLQAPVLQEIIWGARPWFGVLFFFSSVFLVPVLIRWVLSSSVDPLPDVTWRLTLRGVGLGIPALLLILLGVAPSLYLAGSVPSLGQLFASPGIAGWVLWLLALGLGGVLGWQDGLVRVKGRILLESIHGVVRLEWLYDVAVGAFSRGFSALRTADEIVGGSGALIWTWILVLIILLLWGGS